LNEQATVLVVDDVPDNVKLLVFNLEDEGYRVIKAFSGTEALRCIETQVPDIVLLDVMMPDKSGLEVLQTLKASEETAHIPVILVTANSLDEHIAQGLDLGAYDYVIKPFSYTVLAARIRAALREREHQEKLEQLAATDPLTQLLNRRQFSQMVTREIQRVHRTAGPLSLLMLDIDHFKQINDTYGHDVGDEAIVALANALREQVRAIDIIGRFGGDEFVICLPDTGAEQSKQVAERICKALEQLQLKANAKQPISFTVSIGVSNLGANDSFDDLYVAADQALYKAKHSGRNQVCIAN
jgi:two-component system cell cycle response regulator